MSSALDYSSLSCYDTVANLALVVSLDVRVTLKSGENILLHFKEKTYGLSPSSKARRLHLNLVSAIVPTFLSSRIWRSSHGPRLLHKALVANVVKAHLVSDSNPWILLVNAGADQDAVARHWESNSHAEAAI